MDDEPRKHREEHHKTDLSASEKQRIKREKEKQSEVDSDNGFCNLNHDGQEIKTDWFSEAEANHDELQKKLDEAKQHLKLFKQKDLVSIERLAKQSVEISNLKSDVETLRSKYKTACSELEKLKRYTTKSSWKKEIERQNEELTEWGKHCEIRERQFSTQLRGIERALSEANDELRTCRMEKDRLQMERNELAKSREELLTRLSKIAGSRLTQNNPAITDLSDENRGIKLAEQFNELYDTEWTDSLEELVDNGLSEEEAIYVIYTIFTTAFTVCSNIAESYKKGIMESPSHLPVVAVTPKMQNIQANPEIKLSEEIKSQLENIRKTYAPLFCESIEEIYILMLSNILPESIKSATCETKEENDSDNTDGDVEVEYSVDFNYQQKNKDQKTEADILESNQNLINHKDTMNNEPITPESGVGVEGNNAPQQNGEEVGEHTRKEDVGDYQSSGKLTERINVVSFQFQNTSEQYVSDKEQIKYQPKTKSEHEVSENKEGNEDTFSGKTSVNEDGQHCPEHVGNDDQIESRTITGMVMVTGDREDSDDNEPISPDTTQVKEDAQVQPDINKNIDGSMDNREKIEDSKAKIQTAQAQIENEIYRDNKDVKASETDTEGKIKAYTNEEEVTVIDRGNGDKKSSEKDKVDVTLEDADNDDKKADANKEDTEIADTENKDNKLVDSKNTNGRTADTDNEDKNAEDTEKEMKMDAENEDKLDETENKDERSAETGNEDQKTPDTDNEDKTTDIDNEDIKAADTDAEEEKAADSENEEAKSADAGKNEKAADKDMEGEEPAEADNEGKITADKGQEDGNAADTDSSDEKLPKTDYEDTKTVDKTIEDEEAAHIGHGDKAVDTENEDVTATDTNEEKEKADDTEREKAKSADTEKEEKAADKDMEGEKSADANNEGKITADKDQEDGKAADTDNSDEKLPKTGTNIEDKEAVHTVHGDKAADTENEDITATDTTEEKEKAEDTEREEAKSADTEREEKAADKDMEGEDSDDADNEGKITADKDQEDGKAANTDNSHEKLPKTDFEDTKTVGTNIENKEAANAVNKNRETIDTDKEVENIDNKGTETKDKGNGETKAADTGKEDQNVANVYNVSEIADDTDTETKKSADLHNEEKKTARKKKKEDAIGDTREANESEPVMDNAQTDNRKNESEIPMSESWDSVNEDHVTVTTETSDQFDLTSYEKTTVFASKCAKLCWHMRIKDPPLTILFDCNKGADFDTNVFKHYTRTGVKMGFIVWPALYLYENGPLLAKGVAQPL